MLNRSVLIGRLTKDVELRYTPNGKATCNFTLAVDRKFKNAQGEKETDFIPISVPPFKDKLAELCAQYLSKGKLASVDGQIQIRTYTDSNNQKHWITEVIAEDVNFLSPKDDNSGAPAQNQQPQQQSQYTPPPQQQPQYGQQQQPQYGQQPPYPGQYAPPGYQQYQSPPGQGQWQAPPPGFQASPNPTMPNPTMPNPNFPPPQSQQQHPQWLGQPQQNQPSNGQQLNLDQIGKPVNMPSDDIPF